MADKKSKANPYKWPTGDWHSVPWENLTSEQRVYAADQHHVTYDPALMVWDKGVVAAGKAGGFPGPASPGPNAGNAAASNAAADAAGVQRLDPSVFTPNPSTLDPMVGATPQPIDPALEEQRLIANRNVALGKGEAAYQQGNLGFDYGYNPDGTINTANPYSRAALLQLGYEHQQAGTTNSYASQGQLYSGAIQNALGEGSRQYGANEAANRLAYQRGTHTIQAGQLNTVANAGSGVSDADFQALLKATYPGG